MTIVGCDFHPAWQQVAVFDSETGEIRAHVAAGLVKGARAWTLVPTPRRNSLALFVQW